MPDFFNKKCLSDVNDGKHIGQILCKSRMNFKKQNCKTFPDTTYWQLSKLGVKLSEVIFRNFPIMVGFFWRFFLGGPKVVSSKSLQIWCFVGFSPPFIHWKHPTWLDDMTWYDLGGSSSNCARDWQLQSPVAVLGTWDFFRGFNVGFFRGTGPRWLKRPKRHFFTRSILWSLPNIFVRNFGSTYVFDFCFPKKHLPNEEFATKTLLEVCWKLFQMCFLVSWLRHLQTAKVCTWIPWTEPLAVGDPEVSKIVKRNLWLGSGKERALRFGGFPN